MGWELGAVVNQYQGNDSQSELTPFGRVLLLVLKIVLYVGIIVAAIYAVPIVIAVLLLVWFLAKSTIFSKRK